MIFIFAFYLYCVHAPMYMYVCMPSLPVEVREQFSGIQFFPSTLWFTGIKLRFFGLAVGTFTQGISLTQESQGF